MSSAKLEGTPAPAPQLKTEEHVIPDYLPQTAQYYDRSIDGVYKEEYVVGNGAYGTVYKAQDLQNPTSYVAIKKVRIPISEDGVPISILREISLVRQLDKYQHPNIVRFLDVCNGPRELNGTSLNLLLVFEFVDKDLGKYIRTAPSHEFTLSKIKDIIFQIICGVDFLHSQRILHRDLKPQNLLITPSGQVKLADFGLAKIYDFSTRLTSVVVTLWYRSPELLLGASYATPVDMWSVGCILAEMYRRRPLLPGVSETDQLQVIFDVIGTPAPEDWPADAKILPSTFPARPARRWDALMPGLCSVAEDLISGLLSFNDKKRMTAKDALKHPYFQGFTQPSVSMEEGGGAAHPPPSSLV